jgi:hypothetical protein
MKAMLAAVLAALFGMIALTVHAAPLPQSGAQSVDKEKDKDKKDG